MVDFSYFFMLINFYYYIILILQNQINMPNSLMNEESSSEEQNSNSNFIQPHRDVNDCLQEKNQQNYINDHFVISQNQLMQNRNVNTNEEDNVNTQNINNQNNKKQKIIRKQRNIKDKQKLFKSKSKQLTYKLTKDSLKYNFYKNKTDRLILKSKKINHNSHDGDQQVFYMIGVGYGNCQLVGFKDKFALLYDCGSKAFCIHPKIRQKNNNWADQTQWNTIFRKRNFKNGFNQSHYDALSQMIDQNNQPKQPSFQKFPLYLTKTRHKQYEKQKQKFEKFQQKDLPKFIYSRIDQMGYKHLFIVLSHPDLDHIKYICSKTIPKDLQITVFLEGQWLYTTNSIMLEILKFLIFERNQQKTHIQFPHYWGGCKYNKDKQKINPITLQKSLPVQGSYINHDQIVKIIRNKYQNNLQKCPLLSLNKYHYQPCRYNHLTRFQTLKQYYHWRKPTFIQKGDFGKDIDFFQSDLSNIKIIHSCLYPENFNIKQNFKNQDDRGNFINDQSAVVQAVMPHLKMHIFLTGDAGYKTLSYIKQHSLLDTQNIKWKPREDYLSLVMVPHHGSATSYLKDQKNKWLKQKDYKSKVLFQLFFPDIFGISVSNNNFLHPQKKFIQSLLKKNKYQTTHRDGQISHFYDNYECTKFVNMLMSFSDVDKIPKANKVKLKKGEEIQLSIRLPKQSNKQSNKQSKIQLHDNRQNEKCLISHVYPALNWLVNDRICNSTYKGQHPYCEQLGLPFLCTNIVGTIKINQNGIHCPFDPFIKTSDEIRFFIDNSRIIFKKDEKPEDNQSSDDDNNDITQYDLDSQTMNQVITDKSTQTSKYYMSNQHPNKIFNRIITSDDQKQWYLGYQCGISTLKQSSVNSMQGENIPNIQRNERQQEDKNVSQYQQIQKNKRFFLENYAQYMTEISIDDIFRQVSSDLLKYQELEDESNQQVTHSKKLKKIDLGLKKQQLERQKQQESKEISPLKRKQYIFDFSKICQHYWPVDKLSQLFQNINWDLAQIVNFNKCSFNNQHWKIIVQNSYRLAHITQLNLEFNRINDIKKEDIQNFTNLKILNFSGNGEYNGRIYPRKMKKSTIKSLDQLNRRHPHIKILYDVREVRVRGLDEQDSWIDQLVIQPLQFQDDTDSQIDDQQEKIDYKKIYDSNKQILKSVLKIKNENKMKQLYRQNQRQQLSMSDYKLSAQGEVITIVNIKVDLEKLINLIDFTSVQRICIMEANMLSKDWRLFVTNAQKFKKLQGLYLSDNQIRQLQQGDLQKFPSLRNINFFHNPLFKESKNILKSFKQKNPNIKVYFDQ